MWKQEIEITTVPMLHLIHAALAKVEVLNKTDPQAAEELNNAATSVLSALVIVLSHPVASVPAAIGPFIDKLVIAVNDPVAFPKPMINEAAPAAV